MKFAGFYPMVRTVKYGVLSLLFLLQFSGLLSAGQESVEDIKAKADKFMGKEITLDVAYVRISPKDRGDGKANMTLTTYDPQEETWNSFEAVALKANLPDILRKYGEKAERKNGRAATRNMSGILEKDPSGYLYLNVTATKF